MRPSSEVFEIAIDDRERGAQFVAGIGDEVLADLLGVALAGDVADDDAEEVGLAAAGEADRGGRNDEIQFLFVLALVNGDLELLLDGGMIALAALDDLGQPVVGEDLEQPAADKRHRRVEQVAGLGVGEGDFEPRVNDQARVAEAFEEREQHLIAARFVSHRLLFLAESDRPQSFVRFMLHSQKAKCQDTEGKEANEKENGLEVGHGGLCDSFRYVRHEPIAHSPNGFDTIGKVAEFLPQALDVGVERAGEHGVGLVPPDFAEQFVAALRLAFRLDEQAQQFEFGGGEVDRLACEIQFQRVAFEVEASLAQGRVGDDFFAALDQRLDAEGEFLRGERFGDIIVSAEFKAGDFVVEFPARGQHDDRDLAGPGVGPQVLEDAKSVAAGQHQIEHDEVRLVFLGELNRRDAVARRKHLESLPLKVERDQIYNVRFVINNENRMHAKCENMANTTTEYARKMAFW